jgi:hypothetical protein
MMEKSPLLLHGDSISVNLIHLQTLLIFPKGMPKLPEQFFELIVFAANLLVERLQLAI